jgi:hypothetical protein
VIIRSSLKMNRDFVETGRPAQLDERDPSSIYFPGSRHHFWRCFQQTLRVPVLWPFRDLLG